MLFVSCSLHRGIAKAEYTEVVDLLEKLGMNTTVGIQEDECPDSYQPDFDTKSHPSITLRA